MENAKTQKPVSASDETVLMIDGLYNWLARDLQTLKAELLNELKYSALQTSSLYKSLKQDSADTLAQQDKTAGQVARELKYGYRQNQAIYTELSRILTDEVVQKLDTVEGKVALLEEIDKTLAAINEKLEGLNADGLANAVASKVLDDFPTYDEIDYDKITESVTEKTEASVSEHSRQVLEAVAAIPVAENVDYTRIVEEVGDKVLELLTETKAEEKPVEKAVPVEIDYDKIIYGAAEKVVESLPYAEKFDYARIEEAFKNSAESVSATADTDAIATLVNEAVQKAVAEIDYDAIALKVAEKISMPEPEKFDYDALALAIAARTVVPEPVDYDKLADAVIAKMPAPEKAETLDYEQIAVLVAGKLQVEEKDEEYEVTIDKDGVKELALGVTEELDLDALAEKVAAKLPAPEKPAEIDYDLLAGLVAERLIPETEEEEATYEMLLDEEGVQAIAEAVAEKFCVSCKPCEETDETVAAEEVIEETVEEPVPAEVVAEETAEELAVSATEESAEEGPELVDADAGLVVRMKKSFTAKMKQSEDHVKSYYSALKNGFGEYKKINSTVSWHGDRFNYGRETIAKINICGKTLGLYLALDPNDPEFKTTVYHQKDVSSQRAYESTPFMVKIRSEAAVKKALRLVAAVAEKVGAVKKAAYEPTDYTEVFAYATDEQLLEEGLIKVTKEKKVVWNF